MKKDTVDACVGQRGRAFFPLIVTLERQLIQAVKHLLQVSQTITRGGPRTQIAIPAQGMIEFRDALTDLLEEFGTDDGGFKGDLPDGRYMRVDNKNFYFDIGQNNRGIYMRISEVNPFYY